MAEEGILPDYLLADTKPPLQEEAPTAKTTKPLEEKIIVPDLKGVVLYGNAADVNTIPVSSVHGLMVAKDLTVPGGENNLKNKLEPLFLHKPLTTTLLQDLKKAIAQYYVDQNQPLVVVDVPEQNVTSGVLQLVVRKARVGKVEAKGNKYFSSEELLKYLNLEQGNAIDYDVLLTDIDWMNRSPFRHTDLYLTPGIFPGTTNVELLTTDRRPVDFYVGADNTGIKQTGYERIYAGINASNFFGLDHIFNFQYTFSPRFPRYQAGVLNYTAPLPWKHIFVFTMGYEHTKPAIPQFHCLTRSFDNNLRYIIPINPTYSKIMQEFVFGTDFQDNSYRLVFEPFSDFVLQNRAVMTQAMAGYNFSYLFPRDKLIFSAELFYSPGHWLPHQSNATYQKSRPFSKSTYVYGKYYLEDTHRFKNNVRIMGRIKGQLADQNLLFNQYTLGDYYSVRGYKNQFGIDNAFLVSFEAMTPEKIFMKNKHGQYFFLAFFDYALGWDHKPLPGLEPRTVYLMSIGPAFRFQIDPYFWARLDLGFPLHKLPRFFEIVDQGKTPWLQFGLFLKF